MVERQLIKAQDKNEQRLRSQQHLFYDVGDSVWVFQHFRAYRGEKKEKELEFSWYDPTGILAKSGRTPTALLSFAIKTRSLRLKKFKGWWSRRFSDEVRAVTSNKTGDDDLEVSELRGARSDRHDETAFTGVSSPNLDTVAKRVVSHLVNFLVLTPTVLSPEYDASITASEYAERKKKICLG
ncbi:hypothetical protein PHMEG_00015915 [Phytophthora megakarya]|uniref:Uncharacterized protein n=1 Tax=Phytophthora megakarya TaxID=4795 RepID=A0A225W279_9STRA|nr:hypothetical protein PHMEG_00015915 [Phytophthora megakarya]